jgi:2,4-dienoyl-CoA reductase-like NADH-dependent reductase (Old Yellow Enzyme family)
MGHDLPDGNQKGCNMQMEVSESDSLLFTPWQFKSVTAKNRIVISPMGQFCAEGGFADDWHLVQVGRYAMGGAGIVFVEATAITEDGCITSGDLGLWKDEHIAGHARMVKFLKQEGSVPAIQLAHAGRKANTRRPWFGYGPLGEEDFARGERPWQAVAPSPLPASGWLAPRELEVKDLKEMLLSWREATKRALAAGYEIIELHAAHGYLLHQFLSPLSNKRTDAYGGSFAGRIRFPLEVVDAMREEIPSHVPFFIRISAEDAVDGGWTIDDSVNFARELKVRGIDLVDCSSGGIQGGSATLTARPQGLGSLVHLSDAVRRQADIMTIAVGLILDGEQAEAILRDGHADLVAIAREAIVNPNWPLYAHRALHKTADYSMWPKQFQSWLENRARRLDAMGYGDRI